MKIEQSEAADIDAIFTLYEHAVRFQREKRVPHWPTFDRSLVESEITEGRQWKIMADGEPRCVWAVTCNDPLIWGARDMAPAIYIHRIAIDPSYRGRLFVVDIVRWARSFAVANDRQFIRMDTVGKNDGLIDYYTRCGFSFVGLSKLEETTGLPSHYRDATVSLFEIDLGHPES